MERSGLGRERPLVALSKPGRRECASMRLSWPLAAGPRAESQQDRQAEETALRFRQCLMRLDQQHNVRSGEMQRVGGKVVWDLDPPNTLTVTTPPVAYRRQATRKS